MRKEKYLEVILEIKNILKGDIKDLISKLEEKMTSIGLEVRREGRIMRILHEDEDTTSKILSCAAEVGSQIRRMHEYEASLEDLFIVIMENLGYEVKTSQDLLRSPVQARQVDAPSHMGGGS